MFNNLHIENEPVNIPLPSGITLTIKREDKNHPFVSGNKLRKLNLEQINSKTTIKYDPEGKITEKWYVTEKGNCKELYEKGVISQKICEDRSIKETTVSTYRNGKLLETKKL